MPWNKKNKGTICFTQASACEDCGYEEKVCKAAIANALTQVQLCEALSSLYAQGIEPSKYILALAFAREKVIGRIR